MTCYFCDDPARIEDDTAVTTEFTLPTSPKLSDLKSKECTVVELQAALAHLIDLYNEQGKVMSAAIADKQDREWRATI